MITFEAQRMSLSPRPVWMHGIGDMLCCRQKHYFLGWRLNNLTLFRCRFGVVRQVSYVARCS